MFDPGKMKFEIKQVETDDPEKVTYLIKLPDEVANDPEFVKFFQNEATKSLLAMFNKIWLENLENNDG
jgi:hypothetical protein